MSKIVSVPLAAVLIVACITGCSRKYDFSGVVVDGQGIGIADADVMVFPVDEKQPTVLTGEKTDSGGKFKVGWCCTPNVSFFRIVISKKGYDTDSRIVQPDEKDLRIVLSVTKPKPDSVQ